ncbi:hypothetical protein [Streptomyces nigrescens]|uniref:hypothetical protein n=1 Tax=Streptomyces nigrescens TaxID=1920 RepID=UPI0036FCC22F
MNVAVDHGVPLQLDAAVEVQSTRRTVLSAAPEWRTYGLPRAEAAEVRARWRQEVQRLRAAGELLDTRDAVLAHGVRAELAARGWNREWDEAPEEAWDQGRWPGSRSGGHPDRVSARLDEALVRQVVAACWHTSREAITALRAWRDAHPHIVPPRHRPADGDEPTGPLAEYERLAAQVTTTGTIYRAGLTRGINTAHTLTP